MGDHFPFQGREHFGNPSEYEFELRSPLLIKGRGAIPCHGLNGNSSARRKLVQVAEKQ